MFGFGLQKLLLFVFVIGAVWYGFKYFGGSRRRVSKATRAAMDKTAARDMERCEACGDFVAAGHAAACGRAACPYSG